MHILRDRRLSRSTLRVKLFITMLALAALLLLAIFAGLFSVGSFDSVEAQTYQTLDLQMEVLQQDVEGHFKELAVMGTRLSEDLTARLEDYLSSHQKTFDELNDSEKDIGAVQKALFEPLRQKLLQTDCSGAFVLLDATVNKSAAAAAFSKSGLYLQLGAFEFPDTSLLLYRGDAQIGKDHGIMPHRKWRLEFDVRSFPEYDTAQTLLRDDCRISKVFTLPGTSENALLLSVPLTGADGQVYGICGFEISQSYFKLKHAQPTQLERMTCLVTTGEAERFDPASSLSCGVAGGYYLAPSESLACPVQPQGLLTFTGEDLSYVGILRRTTFLHDGETLSLAVMIPQSDYDLAAARNTVRNVIFIVLLLFFAVICCLFFSRRFVSPILQGLRGIQNSNPGNLVRTNVPEIDDLFEFLARKDREHEEEKRLLEDQKQEAQTKLQRLVDKGNDEIDPDSFALFLNNLHTLTPREREIFNHYLEGRTAKEIHLLLGVNENTVKFHNKNIYGKLGVSSRKQLLRYAALMQSREESDT